MKQESEEEELKRNDSPVKNGAETNGANEKSPVAKNGTKDTKNGTKDTTQNKASPSLLVCCVVTLLSFTAGIWTRPLLSHPRVLELRRGLATKGETCNEEGLSHFLHDAPVPGMHVVCLENSNNGNDLELKAFAGAHGVGENISAEKSWSGVRDSLKRHLNLRTTDELHQPWAVFSSVGERIADEETDGNDESVVGSLLDSGLVVLFEGGQWMWPGVRVGYKRNVELYSIVPGKPPLIELPPKSFYTLETLSLQPLVIAVDRFLTEEECDHVQALALPSMRHSSVSFTDADKGKEASDFRTSSNTFVRAKGDNMLMDIDYRTASLVRMPRSHQEYVQVLRYEKTQHYVAHHDYFNKVFYSQDPHTLRLIQNGRKNRLATVFWYLSDVEKGGETVFPRWNGAPQPSDFGDCSKGLKVKPERGKVVIFYSMTPDGELDEYSLHGACPVEVGVKWAANKWVWNLPMSYIAEEQ